MENKQIGAPAEQVSPLSSGTKQFELKKIMTKHGYRPIAVPIGENRKTRRAKDLTGVSNNRKNPAMRDQVRLKMAYFSMSIGLKINKAFDKKWALQAQ